MEIEKNIQLFQNVRPKLMGIAYRFFSAVSDAEDIVQDVYLTWSDIDKTTIKNPEAWLKKVCVRRCLDVVKSVEKSRIDYVGTWLPEPIQPEHFDNADQSFQRELAESLTTAFLLTLNRLTAKERAAFLLHEVFDTPYEEVADTLAISSPACRKLVSRAKKNLSNPQRKNNLDKTQTVSLLNSFKQAVVTKDITKLQTLLANDAIVKADGGGKVPAILQDVIGNNTVSKFLTEELSAFWVNFTWQLTLINCNTGFVIKDNDAIHAIVSFEFDKHNKIANVFIVRNPDKTLEFKTVTIH